MTGPWLAAFVVLWVLVLLLAVLVLGLLRRVLPLLDHLEARRPAAPELGLSAGTSVPAFEARDRAGKAVGADDVPRPGIVLFLEPDCRPCEKLAKQVRTDADRLDGVPLVFVTSDTEEGRALAPTSGLTMLQTGHAVSHAFQTSITPHAFLVDRDGRLSDRMVPESVDDLNLLAALLGPKEELAARAELNA
jgi:peroxiredoxin